MPLGRTVYGMLPHPVNILLTAFFCENSMNRQRGDERSGSPSDNTQPNADTASGASDQTADGGDKSRSIPYDRFKEVNDEKKQYQQRVLQLEAQNQQILQQQQQFFQQQQQQQVPKPEAKPDPNIERVKDILGRDELGKKAFEAMEMLTETKARQIAMGMRDELLNEVNNTVQQRVGGVTASLQTKQQIDNMVAQGRLNAEQGQALQQQVAQAIQQYPQWENQQPILVNTLLGNMYANGTLQSPTQRQNMNGTPLQPGGGFSGDTGSSALQRDAEILKRFPSLRNKPDKDLRAVVEDVRKRQEAVNG